MFIQIVACLRESFLFLLAIQPCSIWTRRCEAKNEVPFLHSDSSSWWLPWRPLICDSSSNILKNCFISSSRYFAQYALFFFMPKLRTIQIAENSGFKASENRMWLLLGQLTIGLRSPFPLLHQGCAFLYFQDEWWLQTNELSSSSCAFVRKTAKVYSTYPTCFALWVRLLLRRAQIAKFCKRFRRIYG